MRLPDQLEVPASWKYSEWCESVDWDAVSRDCKHSTAYFHIRLYIGGLGELALTDVKKLNLFIKRISSGEIAAEDIWSSQIPSHWVGFRNDRDELYEIYNAHLASDAIKAAIEGVSSFMDKGEAHSKALEDYIAYRQQEAKREYH